MKKWYDASGPESESVISSCVHLSRNMRGIPFPAGLTASEKAVVVKRTCRAVFSKNSSIARDFHFVNMASMSLGEAVALAERGVVSADFIENRCGCGLLVSENEAKCILVNGDDHFLIQVRLPGLALKESYESADRLDTILDKSLNFAFDKRLGYLTCNPALLGTGMIVSLNLHLPALAETGAAARISSNLQPLGISFYSALSPSAEGHGAIFRLSNRMTLGLSENEAITNLCGIAGQIIAQERAARDKLIKDISVQDTVERSLGILKSARLLGFDEFLGLASIIRFGIAAGLVKNISLCKVDGLAMRVQPANLVLQAGYGLTQNEERAFRAKIVREALVQREGNGNG
jgi:protein arginine kinase